MINYNHKQRNVGQLQDTTPWVNYRRGRCWWKEMWSQIWKEGNCCHWSKLSEMEWDGQEIMQQSSGLWCGTRDHLHAPVRILVSDSNKNLCFEVSTISPTHKTNLCWFLVVCVKSESPTRLFWLPETGPWTSFYYALKLCEPWGQFLKQKHE